MKINKEFLKKLSSCEGRWKNYLEHYSEFSGNLLEFMELNKISTEDKLWVFTQKIKDIEKLQRKFAVFCMDRCQTDVKEIQEYQVLIMLMYESEDFGSIEHLKTTYRAAYRAAYWAADRATYWAADRAAYWAAERATDRAAEREIQLNIIKYLLRET